MKKYFSKKLILAYGVLFLMILAFGTILFTYYNGIYPFSTNDKPVAENVSVPGPEVEEEQAGETTNEKLQQAITSVITKYSNVTTSASIRNVQTGEAYDLGSQDSFIAASTTKVISAICYLKKVDSGSLSLNESLGGSTAEWHMYQMINRSDNNSWEVLNQRMTYNYLATCSKQIGADSFNISANTIKPSEIADILEDLCGYKLLSKSSTDLLLSYMQNTNEERLIPPSVPDGYTIYHKYGLWNGNLHDAAIIDGPGGKYILTIYMDSLNTSLETKFQIFKEITQTFFSNI